MFVLLHNLVISVLVSKVGLSRCSLSLRMLHPNIRNNSKADQLHNSQLRISRHKHVPICRDNLLFMVVLRMDSLKGVLRFLRMAEPVCHHANLSRNNVRELISFWWLR